MQATQTSELFLGSYRAVRLLGEGGMGQAFLGRHAETNQEVVIKVMVRTLPTMHGCVRPSSAKCK